MLCLFVTLLVTSTCAEQALPGQPLFPQQVHQQPAPPQHQPQGFPAIPVMPTHQNVENSRPISTMPQPPQQVTVEGLPPSNTVPRTDVVHNIQQVQHLAQYPGVLDMVKQFMDNPQIVNMVNSLIKQPHIIQGILQDGQVSNLLNQLVENPDLLQLYLQPPELHPNVLQ